MSFARVRPSAGGQEEEYCGSCVIIPVMFTSARRPRNRHRTFNVFALGEGGRPIERGSLYRLNFP